MRRLFVVEWVEYVVLVCYFCMDEVFEEVCSIYEWWLDDEYVLVCLIWVYEFLGCEWDVFGFLCVIVVCVIGDDRNVVEFFLVMSVS